MLLPPFTLHRPGSVPEALDLLNAHEDSVICMGGTELLLLMKLGLSQPEHVIDCKRVAGLGDLMVTGGSVQIGAAVTHRRVECDEATTAALPVLARMIRQVANVRVRNVGTVVGNLCFAEPHSDPATLLLALGATIEVASLAGSRQVALADFLLSPLQTALAETDLVTRVDVPLPPAGGRVAFQRFARKERPEANVAVVAGGPRGSTRVVVGAAGPVPVRVRKAEAMIEAGEPEGRAGTLAAVAAAVDAYADGDGSAAYKTHLAQVLADRALDSLAPNSRL